MVGWLLLSGSAWAFDLIGTGSLGGGSVQVTEDGELRYHSVPREFELEGFEDRNVNDYVEQVNRINVLVSQPHLSLGAQVDEVAFFSNRYILDGELMHSWPLYDSSIRSPFPDAYVTIEKLWVTRRFGAFEVTAGDVYASFGRGIALNLVKNTNIDIDTSLKGAKVAARVGNVDATLVSGLTNRQQVSQDFPNRSIFQDVAHMVTGARAEVFGLGPASVGAHGVVYAFGRDLEGGSSAARYSQELDALVGGATLSAPGVAGVDWYVEGDLIDYRTPAMTTLEEGENLVGRALYGSGSFYPGPLVVLVEAKDTRETERLQGFATPDLYEVSNVPTLEYERVITEDTAAAVNSNDISGARVRIDMPWQPGKLNTYVSLAGFRDRDVEGLHFNDSPENIGHVVAGVEAYGDRRVLQVNAGARTDMRDDTAEGADKQVHIDADLQLPVGPHDGLELTADIKTFFWGTNERQQTDFTEMVNALSWHRGESWVFIVYQDFTDNPLIGTKGNVGENLYGAGEIMWKPSTSMTLRAFYGAYKAGIRCSGGQCRVLPGFEGARLSLNTTF